MFQFILLQVYLNLKYPIAKQPIQLFTKEDRKHLISLIVSSRSPNAIKRPALC
jgi:hypothetical protein